ncbi:MAG: acyl-CoA dehydrogenase family protein [Myxococcota bacterium]|nr:acyl-CoA dehydrogenase family protein [Myxococcota bacterium]
MSNGRIRSRYYTKEHEAFRSSLRRFVAKEITPNIPAWEEAGRFPRELYAKAANIGLLALGFPEEYGGTSVDGFYQLILTEELSRCGSGGLVAGLMSHGIGAPPIASMATAELKAEVLPRILSGQSISALAISEPGGGSDVAQLRTTAKRDGDSYVVNGEKTFITSGMRADYITTAVRTGGEGMGGVSLLLIPGDSSGLSRTELKKMGWWCSDTATLHFDDCRVPSRYLLGPENAGFMGIMQNFNNERLFIAVMAWAFAQLCFEEALTWAKDRKTFGKPLIRHQVLRHKLVDMRTALEGTRASLEDLTWRVDLGEWPVAEVCMIKNRATQCMELCAKEAVQILGGLGYMQGSISERVYRETKVLAIGGGAEEIMKELAARQLGWLT